MKPVLPSGTYDVTSNHTLMLREWPDSDVVGAQQKAQHFDSRYGIESGLHRMVELWSILNTDNQTALLAEAELLVRQRENDPHPH